MPAADEAKTEVNVICEFLLFLYLVEFNGCCDFVAVILNCINFSSCLCAIFSVVFEKVNRV